MRVILLISGLLIGLLSAAQIVSKPIDFTNRLEPVLESEISTSHLSDKINKAVVIDARDDTSEIGYYSTSKGQILVPGIKSPVNQSRMKLWPKVYYIPSLSDSIANWINNYLQFKKNESATNNLLVVIKKLWLSAEAAPLLFVSGRRGQASDGWDAGIVCKLEFYLEKDSMFYPLYRYDSIFTSKDDLPEYAGYFICTSIKKSLDKLFDIDLTTVPEKRRKLLFADIIQEYSRKKDMPILKEGVYKKGVYRNFEEFKRNSPSIHEYEFKKTEMGDLLYVKKNNSEYNLRTAWGFCDGANLYINSSDKYSKLIRRGDTFYFTGIKGITREAIHDIPYTSMLNLATDSGRKKTLYKGLLKYYQIDMETGEAY
jgi:hypothetical protein